jgi:hypothetical protein
MRAILGLMLMPGAIILCVVLALLRWTAHDGSPIDVKKKFK